MEFLDGVIFAVIIEGYYTDIDNQQITIARQMGHCMGVNFNIHIWAWSASPSVQVGGL